MKHTQKNLSEKKTYRKDFRENRKQKPPLAANTGQIIGITGGIATGKSFVLECFKKLGFEVFNSDNIVHTLLKKGGKAYDAVAVLCPESATETNIDRTILGEIVFTDTDKLLKLETILHPLVRQAQTEFLIRTKHNSGKSAVFEVPLLFENKREEYYDYIVVTNASESVQRERALLRKNMTVDRFEAIIAKQMPNHIKIKKADFVVNTNKTPEITFKIVRDLVNGHSFKRDSIRHGNYRALREKR